MPSGRDDRAGDAVLPRLLRALTRSVSRRPWGSLGLVLMLAVVSLGVAARFLSFKTSRSDLIDPRADFHQRWLHYTELFGEQSDVVVVVEASTREEVRRTLDDLGGALGREDELFDRVLYRIDAGALRPKALQYLSPPELERGLARLEAYGPILEGRWDRAGLEHQAAQLAARLATARETGENDRQALTQARLLCESLLRFDAAEGSFVSPWPQILERRSGPVPPAWEPQYLLNETGTMGFLLAVPLDGAQDFQGPSHSINRLREIIAHAAAAHPDARIGLTGIPVLEADEMQRSQQDMLLASGISFAGVGLLLLIGFRGFRHPALALLMLAVGLAWALGYTTLAVGHLNILSVSFAAILIGLGIDYAIHYLARYLELRRHGERLRPALVKSSESVGTGIATAAVTTSLAFLCATFTNFLGVAELGIIAGGGILLCAAATFLVLPAFITLSDRRVEPQRLPTPFEGNRLRGLIERRPWTVSLVSLAVIAAVGVCGFDMRDGRIWSRVRYDANLLNLQAEGLESVQVQRRLFDQSQGSLLHAVSLADGPTEARRLADRFRALPTVHRVEEIASLLPTYPPEETGLLVQAYRARLQNLPALPRRFAQVDPASIGLALEELFLVLRDAQDPEARGARRALDQYLDRLEQLSLQQQMQLLSSYQYAMLNALHAQFVALASMADARPVTAADLPEALRSRFVSEQGHWLVKVFPRSQIWDEQPLREFVADVRTVDAQVTGTPLQNFEAARQIRESYLDAAVYALAVICLVLLIDSLNRGPLWVSLIAPLGVLIFAVVSLHGAERSINPLWLVCLYVSIALAVAAVFDFANVRNIFLTLLAPLGGGLLMFGILGLLGTQLNPANMIVLPLILGIGIDDGVHVLHDFRLQTGRYRISASTVNAVTLTSLTSMIGFGSMLLAAHRGLASLALVLVIGVGSCLFVSLVALPAVLTLIARQSRGEEEELTGGEDEPAETLILPLTPPLRRTA